MYTCDTNCLLASGKTAVCTMLIAAAAAAAAAPQPSVPPADVQLFDPSYSGRLQAWLSEDMLNYKRVPIDSFLLKGLSE